MFPCHYSYQEETAMKQKIFYVTVLFFLMTSHLFANTENNDSRYRHIHFYITNQTNYPIAFTIVSADGTWEKSVSTNVPMLINPSDYYENTLDSLNKGDDLESFVSMQAAQIGNERENYVIFAENGSSQRNWVSEDIFDGLGNIFVGSVTNQCDDNTPQGYANCTLAVTENTLLI